MLSAAVSKADDRVLFKNNYSITIPEGWVKIPINALKAYAKKVAILNPGLSQPEYDFGFKLKKSGMCFDQPYILVQTEKTGRIPENILEIYEKYSPNNNHTMSNLDVGVMVYDQQNKILWMYTETRMVDTGPIAGIVGAVLTEKGIIQVAGSSLRDDFTKFEPVFRSTALSVRPGEELAYKPGKAANTGITWRMFAAIAMSIIILGVIFIIVRHVFPRSPY